MVQYRWCMILCLAQLANAVCNYCEDGFHPIPPSTLTIPQPSDSGSNSTFDQCNLMGGVYQCSYHALFDCDPNINVFYTWNTSDPQIITAQFPVAVQMVNVVTYSPRFTSNTLQVQVGPQQVITGNVRRTIRHTGMMTTSRRNNNVKITLSLEVDEINPLTISVSSALITNIIFCGRNAVVVSEEKSIESLPSPSTSIIPSVSSSTSLITISPSISSLSKSSSVVSSSIPSTTASTLLSTSRLLSTTSKLSSRLISTTSKLLSTSSILLSTFTPVTTTPIIHSSTSDSNIILIVGIVVPIITLLLVVMFLLITFWCCRHKKLSTGQNVSQRKVTIGKVDTTGNGIPDINFNPAYGVTPVPHVIYDEAVVLEPNPSYNIAVQPKRKRQLDDYDYVVNGDEVISTNYNPSYIPTTVGSNQIQDNPAYKPAFQL